MKIGKFIQLGYYDNIKIGYGSVDCKNLKTIYIKLNSWVEPLDEVDYAAIISKSRKSILKKIYFLNNSLFKKECIVDLDIKTKGVKLKKRSFMDLEITLFTTECFEIKNKKTNIMILSIIKNIIDDHLNDKIFYNFHKTKH